MDAAAIHAEMTKWAGYYFARGWNVLPCKPGEKRPAVSYRRWWEARAPADLVARHECSAIQVMLGRAWRLMVVDLDGPAAVEWWDRNHSARTPRTWITHSGGGGRHVWFSLPPDLPRRLPKGTLWTDGEKHSAAERLCDGSLVVAPPSIHSKSGNIYRYLGASHSPKTVPLPAVAPGWLLRLETLESQAAAALTLAARAPIIPTPDGRPLIRTADILASIHDKIALARSWGVRFTGRARGEWCECHAIDRPDDNPSAAINATTGRYRDLGPSNLSLGFLDLSVRLGVYRDWRDASVDLAQRYGTRTA